MVCSIADIYDEQTDECWAEILQTALKECEGDLVPEEVFKVCVYSQT